MAEIDLENIQESPESNFFKNIAEDLNEQKLNEIAEEVLAGFESDRDSLSELFKTQKQYNKFFDLNYETKNTPWENASNVKLPTITRACFNFWARASINLFPADNQIVNVLPIDGSIDSVQKSERVRRHMNWQLMTMPDFFEGFNKTLMMLPKDGYAFRKTFWDAVNERVVSTYVLPQDFIVNYYTRDLKSSMRYTQILRMSTNDIKIKQEQGIYINTDDFPSEPNDTPESDQVTIESKRDSGQEEPNQTDYATPREVLESHTYLFIGDDKIRRPYIVTIDKESRKVLRIIDRRNPVTGATLDYFTNYTFLPNPNSIFGFGFGSLLLGVTSTMNTSINQMIDAATLSNQKGGWVLKGSQMDRGSLRFKMGQYKQINPRSDDIRKAILPLEVSPPSSVLLNLIQFLDNYTDRLTTVTETFSGGQPRSDTTATAASLAVEQGAKLFTGIQLSTHRALKKELKNIHDLNGIFLNETEYIDIVTEEGRESPEALVITRDDYLSPLDLIPVSDPNVISQQQQLGKAEFLSQTILQNPFLAESLEAQLLMMERKLQAGNIAESDIESLKALMVSQAQEKEQQAAELAQQAELQGIGQELGQEDQNLKQEEAQLRAELEKAQARQ